MFFLKVLGAFRLKKVLIFFTCLMMCFSSAIANAEGLAEGLADAISVEFGKADDDIDVVRVAIKKDISGWLKSKNIPVDGYIETSFNSWLGFKDDIYAVAISPVIHTKLCKDCYYKTYLEAGTGVALLSDDTIDEIDLSSNFQFESRFGAGVKADNFDAYVRIMHYSNAGIAKPNDGINIFLLGLEYSFSNMTEDMRKAIR